MTTPNRPASWLATLAGALAATAIITVFREWFHLANTTIAALLYLVVVLITAARSRLWVAVAVAVIADLCLNYFFMPPLGTFRIADPENWIVLITFLAVATIASDLSATARQRAREAVAQRDEIARLAAERAQFLEERRLAELARQREELKSALLASISHDLRTPLTAIRVAASNLQASWLGEADRREQSDLILAEVERLYRLFENILEMARLDAGGIAAELQWVHPSEIFAAARDQVEHTIRGRRIETAIDGDVLVRLDPRLTASALAHLLENAAQYTPGEAPVTVTMSATAGGFLITVRDHGPGITPADLPHIFERFYRGSEAGRRAAGTGMGLSITKGMIAAEGGRVWVENCADGGARFSIVVPADSKPTAPIEQTA